MGVNIAIQKAGDDLEGGKMRDEITRSINALILFAALIAVMVIGSRFVQ